MLMYFIVFCVIGFLVGKFQSNQQTAFIIMIVIAVLWGISHRPIWGFVSFGELALGYFISRILQGRNNQ